jgi:hypothetical protein
MIRFFALILLCLCVDMYGMESDSQENSNTSEVVIDINELKQEELSKKSIKKSGVWYRLIYDSEKNPQSYLQKTEDEVPDVMGQRLLPQYPNLYNQELPKIQDWRRIINEYALEESSEVNSDGYVYVIFPQDKKSEFIEKLKQQKECVGSIHEFDLDITNKEEKMTYIINQLHIQLEQKKTDAELQQQIKSKKDCEKSKNIGLIGCVVVTVFCVCFAIVALAD